MWFRWWKLSHPFPDIFEPTYYILFPWLDWGIDISDFEKIDFLAHEPYLAFLAPWKGAFLGPQVEFRPQFGGVEYSTCPKIFIFEKYNISAFKWRVERFSTTLKEKKAACLRKKGEKKHPEAPFDWRVSIFWHWGLFWRSHWEGPGWKFWKKNRKLKSASPKRWVMGGSNFSC